MKLKFEPETDDEPEDDRLMRDVAHRYNNWDNALETLRGVATELHVAGMLPHSDAPARAAGTLRGVIQELEDET